MATVTLALALLFGASQTSLDQRDREAIPGLLAAIVHFPHGLRRRPATGVEADGHCQGCTV